MKTIEFPPKNTFSSLTKRPVFEKNDIENLIKGIFEKVENEGDNALKFYAEKFDNQVLDTIKVSQQEIEEALSRLNSNTEVKIVGCGRTDAGVHAMQYFFHAELPSEHAIDNLAYKLNKMLSPCISVQRIFPVSNEMHARFSPTKRTYRYFIH